MGERTRGLLTADWEYRSATDSCNENFITYNLMHMHAINHGMKSKMTKWVTTDMGYLEKNLWVIFKRG